SLATALSTAPHDLSGGTTRKTRTPADATTSSPSWPSGARAPTPGGPDSPIGKAGAPLIVSTPRGVRPTVAATARSFLPRYRPAARTAASRSDARLQADD